MAALSNYLENELLDHVLKVGDYTSPTQILIALFTADDGLEAGTITSEVSGGAYARTTATMAAAASGTSTNSADVTFPTATAAWGTVTHCALMENAAGTNPLFHGTIGASKIVGSDDVFKFNTGDFQCALD
jgi:hypothetical protein